MKRFLVLMVLIVVLVPPFCMEGMAGSVSNQKSRISTLMGENFGYLQVILMDMIRGDYRAIPLAADVLKVHAQELRGLVKSIPEKNRTDFLNLAYNLETSASNLKMTTEVLVKNDRKRAKAEDLKIDYMRDTVAALYGSVVITCVSCHNQFRRHIVDISGK